MFYLGEFAETIWIRYNLQMNKNDVEPFHDRELERPLKKS